MKNKVFIAFILILSVIGAPGKKEDKADTSASPQNSPIQIMLVADKQTYNRNDEISFNAMVMNQSLREIFIYGNLEWGHYASLTLCVRDSRGDEVQPNFIADAITHFENPDDTSQFVKLLPFHFLGKPFNTSTRRLNIQKPGKYSIFAEYHSPIVSSKVVVKPFWGKENGTIQSNVLIINIK